MAAQAEPSKRRVRVWFGSHVIADYSAEEEIADRYAAAMSCRFTGLRLTVDDAPDGSSIGDLRPVPAEQLWGVLTP